MAPLRSALRRVSFWGLPMGIRYDVRRRILQSRMAKRDPALAVDGASECCARNGQSLRSTLDFEAWTYSAISCLRNDSMPSRSRSNRSPATTPLFSLRIWYSPRFWPTASPATCGACSRAAGARCEAGSPGWCRRSPGHRCSSLHPPHSIRQIPTRAGAWSSAPTFRVRVRAARSAVSVDVLRDLFLGLRDSEGLARPGAPRAGCPRPDTSVTPGPGRGVRRDRAGKRREPSLRWWCQTSAAEALDAEV